MSKKDHSGSNTYTIEVPMRGIRTFLVKNCRSKIEAMRKVQSTDRNILRDVESLEFSQCQIKWSQAKISIEVLK